MIETVWKLISTDRRMTLRMMEDDLKISRETISKILVEDLTKWKICARFVSHCLTDKTKALKLQDCQEFIQSVDDEHSLLDSTVTGDETWCFHYDLQTKRQSMEWPSPSSARHKQFSFQKLKNKVMLVTFFDSQGIIYKEYVPPDQQVNKEYYVEVLSCLVQTIHCVRPSFRKEEAGSSCMTT
jgi:hypothetical protein